GMVAARLVDPADQLALVVRLPALDAVAPRLGRGRERTGHVLERGAPVDLGLARAQQIEVRTVQDEHGSRRGTLRAGVRGGLLLRHGQMRSSSSLGVKVRSRKRAFPKLPSGAMVRATKYSLFRRR